LHRNISVNQKDDNSQGKRQSYVCIFYVHIVRLFYCIISHILRYSFHIFDLLIDKFVIQLYVIRFFKIYILHF